MAEVRAPYLQLIVRQCRHLPDGLGPRILARLPPEDLALIRGAALAEWLPFELHQRLQDAKNAEVSEERAAEVTRTLILVALATPVLGGFVSNVLRVIGADPGPAFRWAPRGYAMLFRDCGHLVAVPHPTRPLVTMHLEGLPPEAATNSSFVKSVGHALSAVYHITGFEGTCTLASWDPDHGRATFEMTWSSPSTRR